MRKTTPRTTVPGQSRRLVEDWCLAHRDLVASRTLQELAVLASKELKFPITWSNIRTACRVMSIPTKGKGGRRTSFTDEQILAALCAGVRSLLKAK